MDKKQQVENRQRTIVYKYSSQNLDIIKAWAETHNEHNIARVQSILIRLKEKKMYVTLNYMTIKEDEVKATIDVLNLMIKGLGDGII